MSGVIDIVIVIDGFGIGGAADAARWRTTTANTAAHVADAVGGLHLPTLGAWGLGNLTDISGVPATAAPASRCNAGGMASAGNDTPAGPWARLGRPSTTPAATYPDGFDDALIDELCAAWGVPGVLANTATGGLEVLDRHGTAHVATGAPIVYTSSDSVLQVAAHTDVVAVEALWAWCDTARRICDDRWPIGRIIARPFTGTDGHWERCSGQRRDWAMPAPADGALDRLAAADIPTVGVGKIGDIFDHRALHVEVHPNGLDETFSVTAELAAALRAHRGAVIVVNVADTDYRGHARDAAGYAATLERIDAHLGNLAGTLADGDTIVVCADHGNDPTHTTDDDGRPHLDHTRERVPVLTHTAGAPGAHRPPAPMSDVGVALCERRHIDSAGLGQPATTQEQP
jgi:phosphopentomutase